MIQYSHPASLHGCALATNLSTSVRVNHGPKAHAAVCRSFGRMTSEAASRDCILILLRKRLSPAGARRLREARFQCFAGTYLRHVAGRTSNERSTFCMRPFNQGLYNFSAWFLRQTVHLGGVFPSSRYALIRPQRSKTAAGGSPSGSSNGRVCAAAPRRAQPMVGHASDQAQQQVKSTRVSVSVSISAFRVQTRSQVTITCRSSDGSTTPHVSQDGYKHVRDQLVTRSFPGQPACME